MKTFKKIVDFYIFSNIHVALACFSLTKLSLLYWQNDSNYVPLFVFFATITSYNYIRLTRQKNIKSWLSLWLQDNKNYLLLLSVLSLLGTSIFAINLTLKAVFILLPFSFLTFLYVLPKRISQSLNLRNLPALKIFIIALSWAGITVLFPLVQFNIFNENVLWLFLQRFLFVVVLTIPFDIRDMPYDSKNLLTLPFLLGIRNVKILGLLFLSLSALIEIYIFGTYNFRVTAFIIICLAFLLIKATTKQGRYYSAFWVEGIPILWLTLYYIA
ncbi:MAG: hypothetical protein QM486_08815 [Flavobacteriaceae bacterium]